MALISSLHINNKDYTTGRCISLIQAVKAGQTDLHALTHAGYPGTELDASILPEVRSVGFWDAKGQQNWGLETHCNKCVELVYLESGILPFTVDRTLHYLKPGQLTITRPWQSHSLGDPHIGPGRFHWVILDVGSRLPNQKWTWPSWMFFVQNDLTKLTTLLRQNETPIWRAEDATANIFIEISKIVQNPHTVARYSSLALLINRLFLSLLNMMVDQNVQVDPVLTTSQRSVKLFLDSMKHNEEILAQEWTTASLAEHCCFGVTYFTKLCKMLTNMTPMEYVNYHRVQMAAQMLKQPQHQTITDIAFKCGFKSSQYFSKVFYRYKKCSPRTYRASLTQPCRSE